MDVAIPFAALQYPSTMYYGDGWLQDTPYGSGGYTSAGHSPPRPPSISLDPFNPHLLTAQLAQQGKAVSDSVLGAGFVEVDSGREL